ncbi:MAG TPA: ABC transporter permease [Bacteroidales bacterium]|nr:ABC transporter permease [Bacteroidales bacterium]
MSKIGLIIEREYMTRVKKKSFLLLTFLTPFLLLALVAVPLALSSVKSSEVKVIAVSDSEGLYQKRLENSDQYSFVPAQKDMAAVRKQITQDGSVYAYLVIKGDLSKDSSSVNIYTVKQAEMEMKDFISGQLKELARKDKIASYKIEGLDKIIEDSNPKLSLNTIKWDKDGGEKESSSELAMIIGLIATFVIYIFIFAYGAMVMNGVIEEKINRIVEVIVSSVKPFDLMMGKIIGIAMVGLTQVLLWVLLIGGAIGVTTYVLKDKVSDDQMKKVSTEMVQSQTVTNPGLQAGPMKQLSEQTSEVPDVQKILQMISNMNLGEIVFWFVLYFLGGYLLYASLFAAFGSAIDNQEDSQQFVLPLTIPVLFALYAGMYSAQNPDGPLAFWCSLFPLTSPIVMMVRIPFGVPLWQLLVSYGLLVITFLLVVKMAAKIYRTGILMYGKKVTYKELLKWLRYKN